MRASHVFLRRMEEYEMSCCIRGYHVYGTVWSSTIGEILNCERDRHNASDRYAIAVMQSGTVVGHLPRKISRVFSIFKKRWRYSLYSVR